MEVVWLDWACLTKSAIAMAMPIATAFKFYIGHRKNELLNR
jgi:hypothetical protein